MTPLQRIKTDHEAKRAQILHGDEDELDWDFSLIPQQVGLKQAWVDDNGKLWVITRDGENVKLKRLWHIA